MMMMEFRPAAPAGTTPMTEHLCPRFGVRYLHPDSPDEIPICGHVSPSVAIELARRREEGTS